MPIGKVELHENLKESNFHIAAQDFIVLLMRASSSNQTETRTTTEVGRIGELSGRQRTWGRGRKSVGETMRMSVVQRMNLIATY